jgi:NAD(P)-dependent dehydrogenase (short-subunit alcohol dehydrogenase family)
MELIEAEMSIALATPMMMKELLPILQSQKESRIAIVSSMSAIRGYGHGGAHCAAKGAIDRYANSVMLGQYKNNIYVSTVRPGAIDTGMYDNPNVQQAILEIDKEYNGNWSRKSITLAPPTVVGEAIKYIFTTSAHIPSINIVAKGQFPNEGS